MALTKIKTGGLTDNSVTDAKVADAITVTGSQTGITSVGTLTGLTVSGDANFDSNTLFVDASENKVSIGTTSPLTYGGYYPAKFSVDGESFTGSMAVTEYQDSISGGLLAIGHSRGTISSKAKLNQNDQAGRLIFSGYNGTDFRTITADIRSIITSATGDIADGVMAGNLQFATNAGGGDDASIAMTIDSSQRVGIGETSPSTARLHIKNTGGTAYNQFVIVEGDTSDNNNYSGISFKAGTLANAYPEIGVSNGGLMFSMSGGYHSSNYNNRTKIQLNGSDGHILFMTGGDPAVEKAKLDANGLFKINQNNQGSAGTSNKFLSVGGSLSTQFDRTDVGTMTGMIVSNSYTNGSNQAGTGTGIVFTHHTSGSGISYIASVAGSNGGDRSALYFGTRGSSGVKERFLLNDNGEVKIGHGGDGYLYHYQINSNAHAWLLYAYSDDSYRFNRNGSGSDEMRIESDGDVHILGSLTQNSDIRLKKNIKTIDNALSKVNQLRGVTYNWKVSAGKNTDTKEIGMIADEVEKVIPELVKTDSVKGSFDEDGLDDMKSLKYGNVVGLLVEAVKELSAKVSELENA